MINKNKGDTDEIKWIWKLMEEGRVGVNQRLNKSKEPRLGENQRLIKWKETRVRQT